MRVEKPGVSRALICATVIAASMAASNCSSAETGARREARTELSQAVEEKDLGGPKIELASDVARSNGARTGDRRSSGVLLAPNGLVATNAHAVVGCASIEVSMSGRPVQPGRVVAVDETSDVALVSIPAPPQSGLVVSDRAAGFDDPLTALGFPSDAPATAAPHIVAGPAGSAAAPAAGTVWATLRARALPGMSGGPVVDASGRLVGLVAGDFGPQSPMTLLAPPHALLALAVRADLAVSVSPTRAEPILRGAAAMARHPSDTAPFPQATPALAMANAALVRITC